MKHSRILRFHRQRGAVLVVSLIMLAVMTMFVISMLKTAVIELKIGGSSQVAALNLSNADIAIENFMAVNSGRFAPGFLSYAVTAAAPDPASFSYTGYSGTVTLAAAQLDCGGQRTPGQQFTPAGSGGNSGTVIVSFDVAATAIGTTGYSGATVVHQGLQTIACQSVSSNGHTPCVAISPQCSRAV